MSKNHVKIAIVEDDVYQNKALSKYIRTICNRQVYPGKQFSIKSYYNGYDFIQQFDEDLDILLLDYYLLHEDESESLTGNVIVDEVNNLCEDCRILIITSQEDERIKSALMAKGIKEYVDKNLNSINRVGSIIQQIIGGRNPDPAIV